MDNKALEQSVLGFIGSSTTPVIVCGSDNSSPPKVTLHIPAKESSRRVKNGLASHLALAGLSAKVRVIPYNEVHLRKAATLQELTDQFLYDWIMYDPTGSFRRARAISHAVATCRQFFGAQLKGVYLEESGRRLHAVLDKVSIENQSDNLLVIVREVEALLRQFLSNAFDRDNVSMDMDVRAGFGTPTVRVVAVDAQSLKLLNVAGLRLSQSLGRHALPYATAAFLGLNASLAFATGPAVSGSNAKIEAIGGNVDGSEAKAVAGSVGLPLGEQFGSQLDGAYGEIDDDTLKGIGLHLFTRDPEAFLFGVNGSFTELGGIEMHRVAVEGEAYVGSLTMSAQAGQQSGDVDDVFYGGLDLRYYLRENLMFEAGGSSVDGDNHGHIGAEFMPAIYAIPGLSFYVDAAIGENDYEHTIAGLRYYFGKGKTLIRRHREDDPVNPIFAGATGAIGALRSAVTLRSSGGGATPPGPTI